MRKSKRRKVRTAVDLYCGSGGMSLGARMAVPELRTAYAIDLDPHATSTFASHHPEAHVDCLDVAQIDALDIIDRGGIDRIDFLFAGPTCQAVSTMGSFNHLDQRNHLFVHFTRLLEGLIENDRRPDTVILENVPGLLFGKNRQIAIDLFNCLEERGYNACADVVNFAAHGLPQLRHRFLLIARSDKSPGPGSLPFPTFADGEDNLPRYRTVCQAIGDLAALTPTLQGERSKVDVPISNDYQRLLRCEDNSVSNHWTAQTSEINLRRIRSVPGQPPLSGPR